MKRKRGVVATRTEQKVRRKLLRFGAGALACGAFACGGSTDAGADADTSALGSASAAQASADLTAANVSAASPDDDAKNPEPSSAETAALTLADVSSHGVEDARSACGSTPSGIRKAASESDFQRMIAGVWWLCNSSSVFGTDEAGLLIKADGSWAKLASSDGTLRALGGWGNEGSWETIDTSMMNGSGVYQLNLQNDGSGTVITIPVFAQQPDLMRLDNEGVFRGDYVHVR
jgi:hypothetical protein